MLTREDIIYKLNWFYSLELNQVDLYTAQSKQVENEYARKTLERVAIIEQQHVDNIANKIKELNGRPTIIGDILSPIMGKIAGTISGMSGLINLLKLDIKLEEKAMKDYKDFISKIPNDKGLSELLWSNLIDEDLHTAWFNNKVQDIEKNLLRH